MLIIDEAHNLPSVCCDAASFEITKGFLNNCLRELQLFINRIPSSGSARSNSNSSAENAFNPNDAVKLKRMSTVVTNVKN